MLFGKKEEKSKLPDLPPLPALPQRNTVVPLQTFPELPQKSAPQTEMTNLGLPGRDSSYLNGPQPLSEKKREIIEMPEWQPKTFKEEKNISFPDKKFPELLSESSEEESEVEEEMLPIKPKELSDVSPSKAKYVQQKQSLKISPQQNSDVFVRIDKYHTAKKSLIEIKSRLDDIDELVKRIRETKLKEEQELANWEKDLLQIKSRIQTVTENIFEKVD